jgi:hypothetical protein
VRTVTIVDITAPCIEARQRLFGIALHANPTPPASPAAVTWSADAAAFFSAIHGTR